MNAASSSPTLRTTDTPAQIPIDMLADISYNTGPPSIRNENGQLVGFVFVDITTDDIEGYVRAASQRIRETVQFPPGYYIQWAGQFEYLKSAEQRLRVVVPFTLLIIFVLIYLNTRSTVKTTIVLLAVPFFHGAAFRNLQSGLKWDLDSVCELAGLLGFYLCGVLTLIHQRLAAMEKRLAARDQQP